MSTPLIQILEWTPVGERMPAGGNGFYLIAMASGAIELAPWNAGSRQFQFGRAKEITHWAETLRSPKELAVHIPPAWLVAAAKTEAENPSAAILAEREALLNAALRENRRLRAQNDDLRKQLEGFAAV